MADEHKVTPPDATAERVVVDGDTTMPRRDAKLVRGADSDNRRVLHAALPPLTPVKSASSPKRQSPLSDEDLGAKLREVILRNGGGGSMLGTAVAAEFRRMYGEDLTPLLGGRTVRLVGVCGVCATES